MTDLSAFDSQRSSVRNDYAAKQAANTFSRTLAQQRGSRQVNDFNRSFQRSLPSFSSGFAQRGLSGGGISSGVMKRAMNQYVGDYTRDLGRLREDNFNNLREYDFNASRFTAERDAALADIAARKAATIASTAAHIAALKPYMGS